MFKNKRMGRVMLALAALVVSLVMTVTATYAWFTYNSTVSVNDIQLSVGDGKDVLQINVVQSTTASAWRGATTQWFRSINATAINTAITDAVQAVSGQGSYDREDFKLGAFTTNDGLSFRKLSPATTVTKNLVDAKDGSVLSLKINFRANRALWVGLSNDSKVSTDSSRGVSSISPWVASLDLTANYGVAQKNSANVVLGLSDKIYVSPAYAVRYSFEAGSSAVIWNPQTTTGSIVDKLTAEDDYYVFPDVGGAVTKNFANDYYTQILGAPAITSTTYSVIGQTVLAANPVDLILLNLESDGYAYGQITLNVWFEGCDSSCINSILRDKFLTDLVFITTATAVV